MHNYVVVSMFFSLIGLALMSKRKFDASGVVGKRLNLSRSQPISVDVHLVRSTSEQPEVVPVILQPLHDAHRQDEPSSPVDTDSLFAELAFDAYSPGSPAWNASLTQHVGGYATFLSNRQNCPLVWAAGGGETATFVVPEPEDPGSARRSFRALHFTTIHLADSHLVSWCDCNDTDMLVQPLFAAGGPVDAAAALQHVLSHHPPCPCALGVAAGLRLGKLGSASDGAALRSFATAQQGGPAAVEQGGLVVDNPRAVAAAESEQDQHDNAGEEARPATYILSVECCVLGTRYIAGMLLGVCYCILGRVGGLYCSLRKHGVCS